MADSIDQLIQDLTRGQPFVFTNMAFNEDYPFYKSSVKRIVEDQAGLLCLRADDLDGAGHDLLEKVHRAIDRAQLVIGDISSCRENVYYEVGYALGRGKPLLLIAKQDREIPTDLKGRELIRYSGGKADSDGFEQSLRNHLKTRLGSRFALLRDMLLSNNAKPAYIVASPRHPGEKSLIPGQRWDRRTFGDNLGIRGLLEAFGAIIGEGAGTELVSARYVHKDLTQQSVNLYLIGSKKVNEIGGDLLQRIQRGQSMRWYLGRVPRDPDSGDFRPSASQEEYEREESGDYKCRLYRIAGEKCDEIEGKIIEDAETKMPVWRSDYGLVIRSPHPIFPDRLVVIMAGAHSMGSGAACLAATRSQLIRAIREKLPSGRNFEDKQNAFWALVHGEAADDGLLDETGVRIEEAGWFEVLGG